MKKKIFLSFLMVILGVLFLGTLSAYAETVDYLSYEIEDGEVTITGCDSSISGDIEIPSTIEGYPVTTIGEEAFWGCESLTKITIPNSVTSIEELAFEDCYSLTEITIPNSVTTIGEFAFWGCKSLIKITIPDSVIYIGEGAFSGCSSLEEITIPKSVTSIGYNVFSGCNSLTSINVDENNLYYSSVDGILFNKSKTTLIQYACGKTDTSYVAPNTITSIGVYAFFECESLEEITIPESVTSIGGYAFSGCSSLEEITIPDSVVSIGRYAFYGCHSLDEITIPDSVTSIGEGSFDNTSYYNNSDNWENDVLYIGKHLAAMKSSYSGSYEIKEGTITIAGYAFYGCENITIITIPDSVVSIGNYAFENCISLTETIIPDSVLSIGNLAFSGCENLTEITIPNNLTIISRYAFVGCFSLEEITIPEGVTTIGYGAFSGCESLTEITIPESVTSIGDYAFDNCISLTEITIPNPITSIGDNAFRVCKSLTEITIPNGVTSIGDYAFAWCESLTEITIPESVTSIGACAFYECESLTDVFYSGTEEEWNEIEFGEYNDYLLDATIHFITEETTMTKVSGGGTEFIVSPFNIEEGKTVILALYDNGMFVGMQSALYEGGKITFETDLYYTDAKVMVWGDMESFVPECEAEVINISQKDYTDCMIDVIDEVTERRIYFKNGAYAIDYTDEDTEFIIKRDGEIIEAIELYEDDVVAIFEEEDSVTIEVLVYSITGKIEGIKVSEESHSGRAYKINGEYYNVASCVPEDACDKLRNGYEGLFYTDGSNNILYFVDFFEDENVEFAYVLDSYIEEDKWGKTDIEVMLLTVDGVKTYKVADCVYFDHVEYDINDETYEVAEHLANSTDTIVRVEFIDNRISAINSEHEDNGFEFVGDYFEEWSVEDMAFGAKEVEEDSMVFVLDTELFDESYVTTIDEFVDGNEYEVTLYVTADTDADADIIVAYNLHLDIADKSEFAIITDIEETENEDEEDIYALTIMFEGEEDTYITSARIFDIFEDQLAIGDVVKVAFNNEDVVVNLAFAEFNVARYDVDAEEYADVETALIYPGYDVNGNETELDDDGLPVDVEYILGGYAYYIKLNTVYVECGEETPVKVKFDKAKRIYLVETSGRNKDAIKVSEAAAYDILWDKDLTIEINDEESIYDGKDVADINLLKNAGLYIENEAGEEVEVETIFTQIYATFTAEGDVDMIFLVAGDWDYEIVE